MCGIYFIVNLHNGKYYIGSTISFHERWSGHQCDLRKGKHCNQHLQAAWDKYGSASFIFLPFVECSKSCLHTMEQFFLDTYMGENCYNINAIAGRPDIQAMWNDPEIRAKIVAGQRGVKKGPPTEEHRRKLREAHIGKTRAPFTDEHRAKLSAAAKMRTVHGYHTPESQAKAAASRRGKKRGPYKKRRTGRQPV